MKTPEEDFNEIDDWYRTKGREEIFEDVKKVCKELQDLNEFLALWTTEIGINNIEKIQFKKKGQKEWVSYHP